MQVKQYMTSEVESVTPDAPIAECARKMRDANIGSLPVWEDGQLLGIVTDRDICCRAVANGLDPDETAARDVMSEDIARCYDDQDCTEAADIMEDKHIRRLAVMDRDEAIVGFLSVDDLARCSHDLAGEVLEAASSPVH